MGCKAKYERNHEKAVVLADYATLEETKKVVDDMIVKDGDIWVCKTCNKTAKYNTQIRKHVEMHIVGLSFPCLICGKIFRSRSHLSRHKFIEHK